MASSRMFEDGRGRGRGGSPGLALGLLGVVVLAACLDDRPPASEPVEDADPPTFTESDSGETVVRNHQASERLLVREGLEGTEEVALLFLEGRTATPLPGGGAAWPDLEGGRVIRFDERGRVEEVLAGGPGARDVDEAEQAAEEPLTVPVAVAPQDDGLRVEERDGGALFFPSEGPPERVRTPERPTIGSGAGVRFLGHSVLAFALAPIPEGEPLLWRDDGDGDRRPVGEPEEPPLPPLGRLVNAGWAAPAPEEGTYFAWALRPEVHRFDREGDLIWTATWRPAGDVEAPELNVREGGRLDPIFSTVQHGATLGPDEHLYVLAASEEAGRADRLLVLDDRGVLLREGEVDGAAAVFADEEGRVYTLPSEEARRKAAREAAVPG